MKAQEQIEKLKSLQESFDNLAESNNKMITNIEEIKTELVAIKSMLEEIINQ